MIWRGNRHLADGKNQFYQEQDGFGNTPKETWDSWGTSASQDTLPGDLEFRRHRGEMSQGDVAGSSCLECRGQT